MVLLCQTPNNKRIICEIIELICGRNSQPFELIERIEPLKPLKPHKPLLPYTTFTDKGNSKTNVEPTSTVLLTCIDWLCASTICLQIERPNPLPPTFLVRAESVR